MPFWEIMGISVDWKWRNWLWSGKFLCVHSLSIYFLKYREKEEGKPFDKFVILKWQFIFKICNFNILFYMHTRIKLFFYRFSSMLKKGKRELSLGWPSSILLLYQNTTCAVKTYMNNILNAKLTLDVFIPFDIL